MKKQHREQASKRRRWLERAQVILIDPDCRPMVAWSQDERLCTPRERRLIERVEAQNARR